jgi:hypothetical protein
MKKPPKIRKPVTQKAAPPPSEPPPPPAAAPLPRSERIQAMIHIPVEKPANVKVTPDGVVKLLDFGLVKALNTDSGEPAAEERVTDSPTLTMGATVGV